MKEDELSELDVYVGKRLREKRKKCRMTLSQIAYELDVSHQQVQKYEQGQSRVSAASIYKLSIILGVSPNYFFDGFKPKTFLKQLNNVIQPQSRLKTLNILVAEDDAADELLIRKALEKSETKITIFCLHDGDEIIKFLKQQNTTECFPRPDIIILDLNIPKRDGHEILKEIKRDQSIKDIPVIILTNSVSVSEMITAYKNYASGYICKSFNYQDFEKSLLGMINYWSETVILPSIVSN
jgi:CheY-like chemotaxis protein/DNA-binding XRE family transcriptional regulator